MYVSTDGQDRGTVEHALTHKISPAPNLNCLQKSIPLDWISMKTMMVRSSASLSNPTDDWAATHMKVLTRIEDLSDVLEL